MAVSGLIFIGFVLTHMYGNLKAFAGEESFNEYAHHLRTIGEPMLPESGLLWVIRLSISSRTMRWGGLTILVFLVWHLLNFTIVKVNPSGGETDNPYQLMVDTFDLWWMTLIYLAAMAALALHLHHGTFSAMQTLGWTNSAAARTRARTAGWVLAIVIAGGFSLVPIFVLLGVID